jgi:Mg-chelatase subunit ChlD
VKTLVLAALAAVAPALPAAACDIPSAVEKRPRMEVVFVLDTTGSMGGLIETAKRKIWSVANELARAKPSPEIRMGLVAFRDCGDDYVTKVFDLDSDLDRVCARLFDFQAGGGGDGPESVNQALRDAVTKISWTKDDKVLKVVFLVGDAPPHMDYDQDVPYGRTCEDAVRAGIVLNTLRCGGDPATEKVWTEIAKLSEGVYASIPQEGSEAVATPYDGKLAELGGRLGRTLLAFGDRKDREAAREKLDRGEGMAAAAGPPKAAESVAADRATMLAKAKSLDEDDLVVAVADGKVKLEDVATDKLPEEMQKMTAGERTAFVAKKSAEREALRKEMADLEAKRGAFLADAAKKAAASGGKSTFDLEVSKTLRAQAARKGFTFE